MLIRMNRLLCLAVMTCLTVLSTNTLAVTYNLTPGDDWFSLLNSTGSLSPGDEVILGAGVYSNVNRLSIGQVGTAAQPIMIRAADGANVTMTRPDRSQNVINIEGSQYLTLQGLEVTGGSAGIRIQQKNGVQSKFITLDSNRIHDINEAAVSANFSGDVYEGMHFLNNEIYNTSGTGEGFYLGCNYNECQMKDSIIERNYIHDLNGRGVSQGDGIEIKDGSYNNIIRDNVIHDTNYPAITAYGVAGNGARNIFEGNVMWNIREHAMQVAADAIIRNNLILGANLSGIRSQNHQTAIPGNLTIENNIIRTNGNAIDITSPTGGSYSGPIEIFNNGLYPRFEAAFSFSVSNNLIVDSNVGIGINPALFTSDQFDNTGSPGADFVDIAGLNAYPKPGSKLIGAGNASLQPADDFNTTSRTGSNDVGAYVFDPNGNPGWAVAEAFKEFPAVGLSGDFDGDGDVDGQDFLVWQRNPGVGSLTDWQNNYASLGAAVTTVPEPSSLLLVSLGAILAMFRRGSLD